jgi:hypothetical protein
MKPCTLQIMNISRKAFVFSSLVPFGLKDSPARFLIGFLLYVDRLRCEYDKVLLEQFCRPPRF